MTTPYEQLGDRSLAELSNSKEISSKKLEALRPLFAKGKRLKADYLSKIFTNAEEDEVK